MQVSRGARAGGGCVLTIGNFDGVHRGHQAMLSHLATAARERALPARLLTFEPHPVEFLTPEDAPPRLQRFREKMVNMGRQGVQHVSCLRFDRALSRMPPEDFVQRVLVQGLDVRHLVVGDDFRFGHKGAGDAQTLVETGRRSGFGVSAIGTVATHGERVSSTRIREALRRGELDHAEMLLGWRYSVCGRVRMGQRLGRTIGFPTANIACHRNGFALSGVFAVRVTDCRKRCLPGVANVGHRPTVGGTQERLEVHLFELDEDLYGQELRVEFAAQLRGEKKFDGLDALKRQIAADAAAAREILADAGEPTPR